MKTESWINLPESLKYLSSNWNVFKVLFDPEVVQHMTPLSRHDYHNKINMHSSKSLPTEFGCANEFDNEFP